MKSFTIALFLGVVSASQTQEIQEAINALKIRISKQGQQEIEKEFGDVEHTAKYIKDSRPVRNLKSSLERFAATKEIAQIKKIDQAFLKSPEGKKLVHEWMDVGHVLDENLTHDGKGLHFPNEHMDELSDELNDVVHEYEDLEGSKWDKAWTAGWEAAFKTKQAAQVGRRMKSLRKSEEGQALHKEVVEFKNKVHEHVKVSDVPDHWKDSADLLKISISKEGQAAIEKEMNDVGMTADQIKDSRAVRNFGNSLERWGMTEEVKAIEELDKKFLASREGKELMMEWEDFGHALKEHVKETKDGIHIDNKGFEIIEDEADDIEHEYKMLHGSKWDKAYQEVWEKALSTKEAKSVGRRFETFSKSDEWKMLEKELKDLDLALQTHVKVTDLPEDMQAEIALLKIQVSKEGQEAIEKEFNDVVKVRKAVKHARSVRNLKNSIKRWAKSDEVAAIKKLDKKFWASKAGKELFLEMKDFHDSLKEHVKPTKDGIHIDQTGMHVIEDEADDLEHEYKSLHGSKWDKAYQKVWNKALTSPEAGSVERRFHKFEKSAEWAKLHKELKDLDEALKTHVKVTDVPKDMYLF